MAGTALAADPEACGTVRLSDVGWTDITATTAATSVVLEGLGYEPEVEILSVPVTYTSLKNNDIDVFLGNWMPTMEADIRPYLDDGSVEQLGVNLEGAKYTLAVPTYLAEKGLKDFADIASFADELDGKIYGIEPGNDGNRLILEMIENDTFGLGGFELIESSEQGMLSQVSRSTGSEQGIVFLGWEPHPMNANFDLTYLAGGDDIFRSGLRRRHRLHQCACGLCRRMSECRCAARQSRLHARDGKRDHGRHPERRRRAECRRHRLAQGQSGDD